MPAWLAILLALGTGVSGAVGTYVTLRKEKRDQKNEDDREADRTITLLKEQNELLRGQNAKLEAQYAELKRQGEAREVEWSKREAAWVEERRELRARVSELERDYRNLVLTTTSMSLCANAPTCSNYNPGDRRKKHAVPDTMSGGTD